MNCSYDKISMWVGIYKKTAASLPFYTCIICSVTGLFDKYNKLILLYYKYLYYISI